MANHTYAKLIREYYSKLFELNELSDYATGNVEIISEWDGNMSGMGGAILKVSERLSGEQKDIADKEVNNILETGISKMRHETYVVGANRSDRADMFEYVTSVVGAIYKNSTPEEKKNIISFLFTAFSPYAGISGSPSKFARMVARKAKVEYDISSKTEHGQSYFDEIVAAIYETLNPESNIVKNYDSSKGPLGYFLTFIASRKAIDLIRKKAFQMGFKTVSGDKPIGSEDEDEGQETTLTMLPSDERRSYEQSEEDKKLVDAISDFIKIKLSASSRHAPWLEFYNLFAAGHDLDEISEITGESPGALRIKKMRFEDYMTKFIEDGSLGEFIWRRTRLLPEFPEGRFRLSIYNIKPQKGVEVTEEPSDEGGENNYAAQTELNEAIKKMVNEVLEEDNMFMHPETIALEAMASLIVTCNNLTEFLFAKRAEIATNDGIEIGTDEADRINRSAGEVKKSIEILKNNINDASRK
jgi:hypothetical protein